MGFVLLLFEISNLSFWECSCPAGAWSPYILGVLPQEAALLWADAVALHRFLCIVSLQVLRSRADACKQSDFYPSPPPAPPTAMPSGAKLVEIFGVMPSTVIFIVSASLWRAPWTNLTVLSKTSRELISSIPTGTTDWPRARLTPIWRSFLGWWYGWQPVGGQSWRCLTASLTRSWKASSSITRLLVGLWASLGALCPDKAMQIISWFSAHKQTCGSCQ